MDASSDFDPFANRVQLPPGLARDQLVQLIEEETPRTLAALRSYPDAELDLKPGQKSMAARDLCALFDLEMRMAIRALRGEGELFTGDEAPETVEGMASSLEASRDELLAELRDASDEVLTRTVQFPVGPGRVGAWPVLEFAWLMMKDQIHHRGQLSVYLRVAGAKVPSIYGPSADEPWS